MAEVEAAKGCDARSGIAAIEEPDLDEIDARCRHREAASQRISGTAGRSPTLALTGTVWPTAPINARTVACGSAPSAPSDGFLASMISAPAATAVSAFRSVRHARQEARGRPVEPAGML